VLADEKLFEANEENEEQLNHPFWGVNEKEYEYDVARAIGISLTLLLELKAKHGTEIK